MSVERESVIVGGGTVGAARPVDLLVDAHVHTGFSAGRDAIGVVVSAADRAGLTALTFADQAGPETTWLQAYADAVRRASRRTELTLRVAAEIEIVQPDGWLAFPTDLGQLEAVSVAMSRLPLPDGPVGPRDIRAMLGTGDLTPEQVAELAVTAMIHAVERASRYAPTQLARPLSLLTQVGLDDCVVTAELVDALATACRSTGTSVEISEAWRSPSPRIVALLRDAGVPLLAASDARYAVEVGRWQYLRRI
ncbi:hydrolase [Krasilnikovia sp. MM14-A1004]|uniref:hydrolase n=1 Tax=Krasilnikovia sp. MM14-A1004 TaxID=3373541 RepID=UPI00399C9A28